MSILEHSKRYGVDLQISTKNQIAPIDANLMFLATKFKIKGTGGAEAVHQKGRLNATALRTQSVITCELTLYITEKSFSPLILDTIKYNRPIMATIGKIDGYNVTNQFEKGTKIFEIVGYIQDVSIVANSGDFLLCDLNILVDDFRDINYNNIDYKNEFKFLIE